MDLAHHLAANAVTRTYDQLTPATIDAIVDGLIDSLACALAGTHSHGLQEARQALRRWGNAGCSVWGGHGNAPAPFAAFLNAVSMHALDYDDTDDKVPLHANGMVLPGLIAMIEQDHPECDGRDFLTAVAVGVDGAMRIGRAGGPKGSRGWNYSVISGSVGAVLAIARHKKWDATTTVSALGHQLTQTAGSLQSIIDGSMAKRFQPAQMVKNVMFATALAECGIDGPRNVFEGKAGFINLYQDGRFDLENVLKGVETCALVEDLSLKPYPACRFTHAPIDLALELHARGLRLEDILQLNIKVSGQAVNMVGRKYDPKTAGVVDAQFSIAYTSAVAIANGAVLIRDFTDNAIRDAHIGKFAREQIQIEADESLPFLGMTPVFFEALLHNGDRVELNTRVVSGAPEKRLTAQQLRAKVIDCLQYGQSSVEPDALIAAIHELKEGAPVSKLFQLLA